MTHFQCLHTSNFNSLLINKCTCEDVLSLDPAFVCNNVTKNALEGDPPLLVRVNLLTTLASRHTAFYLKSNESFYITCKKLHARNYNTMHQHRRPTVSAPFPFILPLFLTQFSTSTTRQWLYSFKRRPRDLWPLVIIALGSLIPAVQVQIRFP